MNIISHECFESVIINTPLDIYPCDDVVILEDCYVDGRSGLVGLSDGTIVPQSIIEYLWWNPRWIEGEKNFNSSPSDLFLSRLGLAKIFFDSRKNTKKHIQLDANTTYLNLLHPFGQYSYGHLYDSLSKLEIVDRANFKFNHLTAIVSDPKKIIDFDKHFNVLVNSKMPYISNRGSWDEDGFCFYFCPRMVIIKPQSRPANFTKLAYEFIYSTFLSHFEPSKDDFNKKLFLARINDPSYGRFISNFSEISSYLESNKIKILYGDETLEDIYRFFYNATHISGYHGSLFANTMFSSSECKIHEFCSNKRVDYSFMMKLKKAHDYKVQLVESDESNNAAIDLIDLDNFYKT